MDPEEEARAEENRKRLLQATAATLLLLRRRRNAAVRAGLRKQLSPARIAESIKESFRAGLIEGRAVARAHGIASLERELAATGRTLGITATESRHVVRDVYRAVSQSTSYAAQWHRAATVGELEEASARTNHALERTATTEAVDAFNVGRTIALEEFGAPELGRRWDAKLDDLVCDFCAGLDGTIVALGQSFPDGEPPIHPRCRCTFSIVELNSDVTLWRAPHGRSVNEAFIQ